MHFYKFYGNTNINIIADKLRIVNLVTPVGNGKVEPLFEFEISTHDEL